MKYDVNCKDCKRLNSFLTQVKNKNPDYFCKPVPSFGKSKSSFLIVGLAPGMHGANRTGRPFTGDHAGILLFNLIHAKNAPDNFRCNAYVSFGGGCSRSRPIVGK